MKTKDKKKEEKKSIQERVEKKKYRVCEGDTKISAESLQVQFMKHFSCDRVSQSAE